MKKTKFIYLFIWIVVFRPLEAKLLLNHSYQSIAYFVRHLINQYQRPITLLEVGAHEGQLSFSLRKKYWDTTFVLLDWDEQAYQLQDLCHEKKPDNMVLLGSSLATGDLQRLSECEHFDIVVVYHAGGKQTNKERVVKALLNMGDFIIFAPSFTLPDQCKQQKEYHDLGCCALLVMNKQYLQRIAWVKDRAPKRDFKIKSNFSAKKLFKRWELSGTAWQRGINLYTFVSTRGLYPSFDHVANQINGFEGSVHNDIWLGNMIIQGSKVRMIDFDDRRRNADPKAHLDRCIQQIADVCQMVRQ